MTGKQAAAELTRLCMELGRKPDVLTAHQRQAWLRVLEPMGYERGRAAITHLVNTWARDTFPPPGALTRAAQEATLDGVPNAGAYSQGSSGTPWHYTPAGQYAIWRQERIARMEFPIAAPDEPEGADPADPEIAEGRYWAYTYDTDNYRGRCERVWTEQWRRGAA